MITITTLLLQFNLVDGMWVSGVLVINPTGPAVAFSEHSDYTHN